MPMLILRTLDEIRSWRHALPSGSSVGFVPTMGALHAGHMKLVEECRAASDLVVVSIFVNPLQFGPTEDLSRYPRPFENDAALCETAGVDVIFAPEAAQFYSEHHATFVDVHGLDVHLCGAARPGHFRGVCTVVLKLFNVVKPRRAWFGKKDIQQALILKRMVEDLAVGVEMVLSETVREPSGLALSSRNVYLTAEEKERATSIHRGLVKAREMWTSGTRNATELIAVIRSEIEESNPARIDYIEVVSQARLEPLEKVDAPALIAVAVFFGHTRLIDNALLDD